jgi:hypothetical protein
LQTLRHGEAVSELALRTQLDQARAELAEIETVEEAANVRAFAELVRYAARQAKAGMDAQNEAAEIRLRAERRAGELLKVAVTPSNQHTGKSLPEGVRKHESHRFQRVAEIQERPFEQYIAAKKKAGEEITTAELLRKAAPPPPRDIADEALRAIERRSNFTRPSRDLRKEIEQMRAYEEQRDYYASFGDRYGCSFHAYKTSLLLRKMAAGGITLTDEQADRLAALLREAADALDAVRKLPES